MTTLPLNPRSERGVALIIVLLLLAVMSGLATGMAINSQVEVAMSSNEMYYAGARAAAEAGLNRAVTAILDKANPANPDNGKHMLYGFDDAAGTPDDGDIGYLMPAFTGWPENLGVTAQYSYTVEIFDDDDNDLYPKDLTPDQVAGLGEAPQNPTLNLNDRLIIRATGFGPKGTVVRVARLLESEDSQNPGSNVPTPSNPAILVNGDLTMAGNFGIEGLQGNVHSNSNIVVNGGSGHISGNLTAVKDVTADPDIADGRQSGDEKTIHVEDIQAANYAKYADYFLNADGSRTIGSPTGLPCGALCNGWSQVGTGATSEWKITGNTAPTGTFYVTGTVSISGSPGSAKSPKALAVIATGSISVTGSPYLTLPAAKAGFGTCVGCEPPGKFQFVTNGDLKLAGNADVDADITLVEGRVRVREQIHISGNPIFQGQVIVQDVTSVSSAVTSNTISGHVTITYDGTFDPLVTFEYVPGTTKYKNNVSGWIE